MGQPDWRAFAVCRDLDPEVFFDGPPCQAIAYCETCPVREPCLDTAMGDASLQGVWGGTTERQRKALRRSATTPDRAALQRPQTAQVPSTRHVPSGNRYRGVRMRPSGRYEAHVDGINLGRYDTAEEAAHACELMRQRLSVTPPK